ncbi:zinc iron permease [Butyriboletus roseoflavus]|nr:zinc iron permease [Butyriboletus roseoflavus]
MPAVSFPTFSRHISFLRIPRILFFIGKHFGTGSSVIQNASAPITESLTRQLGVILSTAFVHLLQDSFEALRNPAVQGRWNVGEYIMLAFGHISCRMQVLFLIRHSIPNHRGHVDVSTSYVDQLHSYSSPSTSTTPTPPTEFPADLERAPATPKFINTEHSNSERSPLIETTDSGHARSGIHHDLDHSYGAVHPCGHTHDRVDGDASAFFEGHHRHEPRDLHQSHHERNRPTTMYGPEGFAQGRPSGMGSGHRHHYGFEDVEYVTDTPEHDHFHQHSHVDGHEDGVKVGKKRQIVGILVLQLGIMIHSLVIGMTLSITSGPDFTTLLIAVIFHQLFEGLSLGIRIASLPSSQEPEFKYLNILKPTLASLFAITTPAGILLGMLVFNHDDDMAHVLLTQGIMSAISAGMLTYAACVEMLAGDFVMDPILWRSGVGKQALALFSLAAGVTAMALVGS